jgi:hypothetical protein
VIVFETEEHLLALSLLNSRMYDKKNEKMLGTSQKNVNL